MYIRPIHQLGSYQQPPPPPPPPSPPVMAATQSGIQVNIMKSVRIHAVAATLVTLITLGLGLAILLRQGSNYVASSIVYVAPVVPKTLTDDHEMDRPYEPYVQQQIHTVTRYDVLADALRSLKPGTWQLPGETERQAVKRLTHNLDITRVGQTFQVQISLYGDEPGHLAEVVNAITQTYIDKTKGEEFYGRDDRLATLREERARVQAELDARLQEQANVMRSLGVATVGDGDPYDAESTQVRSDLVTAHQQRIQAEAQLAAIESGDPNAPNSALNAAADEIIATDPSLTALKASLSAKRATLLDQLAGLTPTNPVRKATEDQLAQIDKGLQQMQTDLRRKAAARTEQKLRGELKRASTVESKLMSDLQNSTRTATTAAPKFQRAESLKTEIDRLQARYAAVDERTRNIELESSSPGSVHLFSPALTPMEPEPSKARKYGFLLLPLSMLAGILAALGIDRFDPRIYSARDIESVLGFAPIGMLLDDREVTQLVFDECGLRLAAGIDQATRLSGVRTFVLTAVNAGSGTTSIVENLGSTLARLGRKTLTIDASGNSNPVSYVTVGLGRADHRKTDSKNTDPRHADGRNSDPRNADIRTADARNTDIRNTDIRSADIRSADQRIVDARNEEHAAPRPGSSLQRNTVIPISLASHITPLPSFMDQAFQDLTNEYDIVLIDATPLLISAESEYLARFADVTVLVVESGKTSKGQLKRAARLLERLNATGVAAVINKVGLLRAEDAVKEDLREFEARVQKMNLRWKPASQPQTSSPFSGPVAAAKENTSYV